MKIPVEFLKKRWRIAVPVAAFLVLICVVVIVFSLPKPVTIAVLNIDSTSEKSLRTEILKGAIHFKHTPRFVELDPAQIPSARLLRKNKIDLLILETGETLLSLAGSTSSLDPSILKSVPSSARTAVTFNTRIFALPLLAGHYELAAHRRVLSAAGQRYPSSLAELETSALALLKNLRFPVLVAGGDDQHLGMFLAALIEARSGLDGWQSVVAAIQTAADPAVAVKNPALDDTISLLRGWQASGILHTEWLNIKPSDLVNFMENRQAGFVFMDMGTHRSVDHRTIDLFETSFVSSNTQLSSRSLIIPLIVAIPVNTGRNKHDAARILEYLASDESQSRLSSATGFAPVSVTATPADRQSADVRFWLAASERPLTGLFTAATADPVKQKAFAAAIRARLRE